MKVIFWEWGDDQTLICSVQWDDPSTEDRLRVNVKVEGVSSDNLPDPNQIPEQIQMRALKEAQRVAQKFSELTLESQLHAPRP